MNNVIGSMDWIKKYAPSNRSAKAILYRWSALRLTTWGIELGLSYDTCWQFYLMVDGLIKADQFSAALAALLKWRTQKRPARFGIGTAHWLAQAKAEDRAKAALLKGGLR